MKLVLFDIDGTLLSCGGAGMLALERAANGLFGERVSFRGINPAGGMDPLLFRAALERADALELEAEHDRFRDRYLAELALCLEEGRENVRSLPGVHEALAAVRALSTRVTLGVLTGNYGPAAHLKLRAVDVDPTCFAVTAFGDEAPSRPALVEVALERCAALHGRAVSPPDVVVIGDTIKDVACASANGCLSLAVCTGSTSAAELAAAGATRVVNDLSDLSPLWELLA
ncbi:MAG: HAD family hydrolase [Myxococcota bacterium]